MKSCWGNGLRGILALALLSGGVAAHAQTPAENPAKEAPENPAPVVVTTRIVTEAGQVLSEPAKGINVEIGKPLERAKVAQSVRLLYRTGDYADMRAALTAVDGG